MNLWVVAGSLAAVLAVAGIAWMLGFGHENVGTEADVGDVLAELLPDFTPDTIWVSHDWKTALAIGDGRIAVLRSHGARFVALSLPNSSITRTGPDDFLVETGDKGWRAVRFGLSSGTGAKLQSALDTITDSDVSKVRA